MKTKLIEISEPFGTIVGVASGGVESYSCDYDSADEALYPNRTSYRSYYDGLYMGYKWQCVEFARRWLYVNKGYIFNDVNMAYEIFNIRTVRDLHNNKLLPLNAFRNGSQRPPEPGCLLIWKEGGEFENTGHVAIVTEVTETYVRIVEQNASYAHWPNGQDYAREIHAKVGTKGDYWLECSFDDAAILGWVIQTDDTAHAEPTKEADTKLLNLERMNVDYAASAFRPWLNIANADEEAYVDMMGGHWLSSVKADHLSYFAMSSTAQDILETATDELHGMFMHATDYVLHHDHLLEKFGLPVSIIPRLKQSWENRLSQLITSRFDFAMCDRGLKVYEYNCDSASCYMETGKVQGKWARHLGIKTGVDAGADLFSSLKKAWQDCEVEGIVHLLQDHDAEENYHALFMRSAIEAAGYECIRLVGLEDLSWNKDGVIVDRQGNAVKWVWKTWAWETALDQLRDHCEAEGQPNILNSKNWKAGQTPRLADVLLHQNIMVFEPLWTLIPSNKAILPILWSLFPNHPYLLNTDFELNDDLLKSGYVVKPIVGRCGSNIQLIDNNKTVLADQGGNFSDRDNIYQQLFALPKIESYYVQVSTFTASGNYAGASVRVDKSMIIGKNSDCMALRVLDS